ncbi:methyl-accepting chemotaxis protein [Oleidesulfovibrio sp.]|uniref:methyl-accepting chemotaxis protein n=1 Tax=Oleidesulfovibrio sp. TaxID=2909707 RepID=UPI003A8850D5
MSQIGKLVTDSLQLIDGVRRMLNKLVSSREHEFLSLGESLMSLSGAISDVQKQSGELVSLVSGDNLHGVTQQLAADMGKLHELCSLDSDNNLDELGRVRNYLLELIRLIKSYSRVVRSLQMLGISTRIESARLGSDGKGFNTLADDVEKLAGKIVEYSGQIVQYAQDLDKLADGASARSQMMISEQQACALEAASGMNERVVLLQQAAEEARERSEQVDALMADIADSMGQVVSSVQFHDIVRQQVEHVDETLDSLSDLVSGGHDAGYSDAEELAWIVEVCRLQVMQLDHSRDSFLQAVSELKHNLEAIAGSVTGVARLAVSGDGVGGSALDAISQTITDTSVRMRGVAAQGVEMGETMTAVASTVADMAGFLEHIEDVGAEIELIALNASIKAAHTGDKGKALGVLASSIQSLSQDAGNQTVAIADKLGTISSSADNLKQQAQSFHDATVINNTIAQLEEVTGSLRTIGEQAEMLGTRVGQDADSIAAEIESVVQNFSFEDTIGEELSVARRKLEGLIDRLLQHVDSNAAVRRPAQLDAIMNRYTMKQERDIHMRALGGAVNTADDGDDNIELF